MTALIRSHPKSDELTLRAGSDRVLTFEFEAVDPDTAVATDITDATVQLTVYDNADLAVTGTPVVLAHLSGKKYRGTVPASITLLIPGPVSYLLEADSPTAGHFEQRGYVVVQQ